MVSWGSAAAKGPLAICALSARSLAFASPASTLRLTFAFSLALVDASNVAIQEDAVLRVTLLSTKPGTCDLGENVGYDRTRVATAESDQVVGSSLAENTYYCLRSEVLRELQCRRCLPNDML